MQPFTYIAPSTIRIGRLKACLPPKPSYSVLIEKADKERGTLLDTFENDLQNNNLLLLQTGSLLSLVDLKRGTTLQQENMRAWRLAHDLEAGDVTSALLQVSKLRAFLPVAELSFRMERGTLLDDERKTRCRFQNLILYGKNKTLTVGITGYMRGYDRAHTDLTEALLKSGAVAAGDIPDLYSALAIKRKRYNSRPSIPLDGNAPAIESGTRIIRTYLVVARANETGIIADTDTEFLHDYRVSFRKIRSVLSLFKGIFEADLTGRLKEEFSELMQHTNRLRDLDVYLLERKKYFDLTPSVSHPGLEALFEYFAKEREKELKRVIKNLKNKKYRNRIKTLETFFSDPASPAAGPDGPQPSQQYAAAIILKRYNQVCRIANSIDENTEDRIVHKLRISCKKLRYLMEFFTPLFPEKEMGTLIRSLKVLQDNLGRFNDYSVQQNFLRRIIQEDLPAFGEKEILVTESIGALTAMLFRRQLKERRLVMKNFARFDSTATQNLFKQLFTYTEGGS
jgi:CHAD domain-containing protein